MNGDYKFSREELASLDKLFKEANTRYQNDETKLGIFKPIYQKIFEFISIDEKTPKPGVDKSVWLWVRGARNVNAGIGYFSDYIREYTALQYKFRTGKELSISEQNRASNAIGLNFSLDALKGNLPSFSRTGLNDAGAAASKVFDGNYSPWAGTLLFVPLGNGDYFRNWVLNYEIYPGFKTTRGTYDLFSILSAVAKLPTPGIFDGFEIDFTFKNNRIGKKATQSLIDNLKSETDQFYKSVYDVSTDIGDDLWVKNILLLDALNSNASPVNLNAIYGVGTFENDDLTLIDGLSPLLRQHIINTGLGDDTVHASEDGNDLIDGAEGADTVDYSSLDIKTQVRLQTTASSDFESIAYPWRVQVAKNDGVLGLTNTDSLFDVEKVILSQNQDEVTLTPERIRNVTLEIDASNKVPGDTKQAGRKDTLNLEALDDGVAFRNNELLDSSTFTSLNPNLKLKNFEIFKYGSGNDVHYISDSISQFHDVQLGAGDDIVVKAVYGSRIETGSGKDIVTLQENVIYSDLSPEDRVVLPGKKSVLLTGGAKSAALDSPYVTDKNRIKFAFNKEGQLVVSSKFSDSTSYISSPTKNPKNPSPVAGITLVEVDLEGYHLEDAPSNWFEDSVETAKIMYRARTGVERGTTKYDPLVLDLDGDGVELKPRLITSSGGGTRFDLDGDQFSEVTGWVNPDDGLLVFDHNNNGKIDDVSELFGFGLTSGFSELSLLDTNKDKWFSDKDQDYSNLRIWQDTNENGLSEAQELKTLIEADIKKISLSSKEISRDNTRQNAGNQIAATSVYHRFDNSPATVSDVRFEIDNYNTTYLGDKSVSRAASILPNAKGYGILPDLHVSMTQDRKLLNVVKRVLPTLNTTDIDELRNRAMPIFAAWGQAGIDIIGQPFGGNRKDISLITKVVDGKTRIEAFGVQTNESGWKWEGRYVPVRDENRKTIKNPTLDQLLSVPLDDDQAFDVITADQLAFLERYFGESLNFNEISNSGFNARKGLQVFLDTMNERMELLAIRFAVQAGPLNQYFVDVAYDVVKDNFYPTSEKQLVPTFESILTDAPKKKAEIERYLTGWSEIIRIFIGNYDRQQEGARNTYSFLASNLVAAYENIGLAIDFTTVAEAFGIPEGQVIESSANSIEGTKRHDIFYISASSGDATRTYQGGEDIDAYIVGRDFGNVVIEDIEAPLSHDPDILRFAHLNLDEVTFYRDGTDLIIKQTDKNNQLTVKRHFDDSWEYRQGTGVEEITFADGNYLDRFAISERTPKPSITSDVIKGTGHLTFEDGGAGFDTYTDTDDGDVYLFGIGDDHDLIKEDVSIILVDNVDHVQLKAGVTKDDLRFEKSYKDNDLHIYIKGTDDVLSIIDQYSLDTTVLYGDLAFNEVELFRFDDGSYLSSEEARRQFQQQQGNDGNNFISGTEQDDYLDGKAGNDYLVGSSGSDVYTFGKGYGFDYLIDHQNPGLSGTYEDTLLFAPGVSPEDVEIHTIKTSKSAPRFDFIVGFKDDSSQLRLYAQIDNGPIAQSLFHIEHYQFQDSAQTRWSREDVIKRFSLSNTDDYKTVKGNRNDNILVAKPGREKLIGGNGDDMYQYGLGDGHDIIENAQLPPQNDILRFEEGINPEDTLLSIGVREDRLSQHGDLHITFRDNHSDSLTLHENFRTKNNEIKRIEFSSGVVWDRDYIRRQVNMPTDENDYIRGYWEDDILQGLRGDDYLDAGKGNDTYIFNYGDGHDVIEDLTYGWQGKDTLLFGRGITPESLILRRDENDLIIDILGTSDWLTIRGHFKSNKNASYSLDFIRFDDGKVWDRSDVESIIDSSNNRAPIAKSDRGFGVRKNGSIRINARDLLANDRDVDKQSLAIMSVGEATNGHVELLPGGFVEFTPEKNYTGAATFQYAVHDAHGGYSNGATVSVSVTAGGSTSGRGGNTITGTGSDDVLFGSKENDRMIGRSGNDTLLGEDGRDTIIGGSGNDVLVGGSGNDSLRGGAGDDELIGSSGDDRLNGNAGDDLLTGGAGNDFLQGGAGSDTFVLSIDAGVDTIKDFKGGSDFIGLTGGLTLEHLSFRSVGNNLLIDIDGELSSKIFGITALDSSSFALL